MKQAPTVPRLIAQLAAVRLSLVVLGFGRTLTRYDCESRAKPGASTIDDSVVAEIAHRLAAAAALFPGRAQCLEQSIVLHRELWRRGAESRLRFGIHPYPFAAHAWVEVRGRAINEAPDHLELFTPLQDSLA